ncbi:MAG: succinate dehydrogenase flavoprotein subunit, partial [Chlamydiae bacterium]|nr:succinate dehydrogenase flavoprotein subunit [Chlamydiota bacterium]
HMTNIAGCFNVGESEFQYHGANRLGANSLLSCIFAGLVAGGEVPRYLDSLKSSYGNLPSRIFSESLAHEEALKHDLLTRDGSENVHSLHNELSELMVQNVTVKRDNNSLKQTIQAIKEIRDRMNHICLDDRAGLLNQTYQFANQFSAMIELALVIAKGALLRDEFRGAHFKPSFPHRDDDHWLKTTIAQYDPTKDEPVISYIPVDTRHLKPIPRDYSKAKKIKPSLENIPKNITLPV